MTAKFKFSIISYFAFLILSVISCDDGCGGSYPGKYKITKLNWYISEYSYSNNTNDENLNLTDLTNNTVTFNKYSILITPEREYYFAMNYKTTSFNVISSAYACSPVPPSTDEKIKNIEIFSNKDFDENHLAGSNLAELFNIVVFGNNYIEKMDLTVYFSNDNQEAGQEIALLLKSPPESSAEFEFTVKYYQDGIDMNYYEFTTNAVTITN